MNKEPFFDVEGDESDFLLPRRKWRELVFTGAMKPADDFFVRDPDRPLPPFDNPNLFPLGVRFRVRCAETEKGEWMRIERVDKERA